MTRYCLTDEEKRRLQNLLSDIGKFCCMNSVHMYLLRTRIEMIVISLFCRRL